MSSGRLWFARARAGAGAADGRNVLLRGGRIPRRRAGFGVDERGWGIERVDKGVPVGAFPGRHREDVCMATSGGGVVRVRMCASIGPPTVPARVGAQQMLDRKGPGLALSGAMHRCARGARRDAECAHSYR